MPPTDCEDDCKRTAIWSVNINSLRSRRFLKWLQLCDMLEQNIVFVGCLEKGATERRSW